MLGKEQSSAMSRRDAISLPSRPRIAIGLALVEICEAVLLDENSVLSSLLNDYLGVSDVYLSVPVIINREGVARDWWNLPRGCRPSRQCAGGQANYH